MPWNESTKMDEKLKFISRYLNGDKIVVMTALVLGGDYH